MSSEELQDTSENLNNISSDSTSTFEFIESSVQYGNLLADSTYSGSVARSNKPVIWSTTKEEKQKHNEEIVMESANYDNTASSWEKIEIADIQKEELEACRNFLLNEKAFNSTHNGTSRPTAPSKPCFIDASSLLDDEYTPISISKTDGGDSSSIKRTEYAESAHANHLDNVKKESPMASHHDIKDQYSALPPHINIPRNYNRLSNKEHVSEYERHQGQIMFQNVTPHFGGNTSCNEDYASDISFPSEYSSGSTCGTSGTFNNLVYENTSGYSGSTNYSRFQSDVDSINLPDTPYNSIVQIGKKLESCAINNNDNNEDDFLDAFKNCQRSTSSPVQIPKRIMKHDESAPILSGGASIIDFAPKSKTESPLVRRKTDSCPIVSGGSMDIEEEVVVPKPKSALDKERSSFSWVVDFKNDLKIEELEDKIDDENEEVEETQSKSSYCATPKNSLGFYVDFNSLEAAPEVVKNKSDNLRKQSFKKSTGFFVDLSFSDQSCPNTPKYIKEENLESHNVDDKKKLFDMYVDLESEQKSVAKAEESEIEIPTPSSSKEKMPETPVKKGCFMFIENDSHIVKHRGILPKEPSKRHSWNVNPTPEIEELKSISSKKVYQRSTSVNIEDKSFPSSLPNVPSKTSSMSIGSSLSPHEDFSCSKSLSSRSNISISTSNTSIENSETKVQLGEEEKVRGRRKKEAKINETYDKSSVGSITDEILKNDQSSSISSDTDDVTFQNPKENFHEYELLCKEDPAESEIVKQEICTLEEIKNKMDTIVETSENSSPFKKAKNEKCIDNNEITKVEQHPQHTMESLQQLIEKQKQILENVTEPTPFVKLSDLDKPPNKKDYPMMSTSAGYRVSLMDQKTHSTSPNECKTMSRSTGNYMANLASSVENSKSLSRLFPHLSKVFSSSVPSNVGLNTDQSLYEYIEFISSDFSCTSSINSSRSGMDSADESSISCRQPRRLGEDLLKMFLQEIGTDVIIQLDDNVRRIKAHKIILSSRCQYFAAMLAGGVGGLLSLSGYRYEVVHFALCHVYSGAAHVPPGLDLMELASLSDLLGLEGLKEVTGYALKTNYCHNFHKPCSGCIDGVMQVMTVTLNHGFDELYRKCLKWTCRHFCKIWVTRSFGALPFDVQLRCAQQITAHFSSENVLDWILDCEDVLKALEHTRWDTFDLENVVRVVILDSAQCYILDHFSSLIASDSFLSLGHDRKDIILKLEHSILRAAASLSPDQACKSYPRAVRLNTLLNAKLIKFPSPLSNESFKPFDHIQLRDEDEEIEWNDEFIKLVSALLSAVEQSLIRQCSRAMKCSAWQRMDADLRNKIQKIACVTESDDLRRTLRSSVTSLGSVRSNSASSSTTRANDLRQVKLVIQAHTRKIQNENSNIPIIMKPQERITSQRNYQVKTVKSTSHIPSHRNTEQFKPIVQKPFNIDDHKAHNVDKNKFNFIKARYMEPRKTRLTDVPTTKKTGIGRLSSSENSTRDSSPAFAKKKADAIKKSSNLSLDSLQSPAKQRRAPVNIPKKDSDLSIDSINESTRSSLKPERTSSESLVRKSGLFAKTTLRNSVRSQPLQTSNSTHSVQKSFLSQKSREILSNKARKLSTNSNSSIATKSTKSSSPRMIPINKSHSTTTVMTGKKVYNTTLHLRKTSQLPELKFSGEKNSDKLQKKEIPKIQKVIPRIQKDKDIKNQKEKETEKKKINQIKSTKINLSPEKDDDSLKDESYELKMARSNTFSKEADNPIELLKTMN